MSIVRYNRPAFKRKLIAGHMPPWLRKHIRRDYIVSCILSCPPWVDRWELEALRAWAKAMTAFTGQAHVLDHITPVTHPRVCGLTVPWNLQVVHWLVNAAKGNTWNPDQLELFQ